MRLFAIPFMPKLLQIWVSNRFLNLREVCFAVIKKHPWWQRESHKFLNFQTKFSNKPRESRLSELNVSTSFIHKYETPHNDIERMDRSQRMHQKQQQIFQNMLKCNMHSARSKLDPFFLDFQTNHTKNRRLELNSRSP